jgi:AraC-like DNA-binding protein
VVLASPIELCAQLEKLLGAPVLCGRGTNYVSFDSALLDEPLPQADATTLHSCLSSCDELISTLRRCDEIRRRVREMILRANGAVPTLSQIAGRLFLSTRTLRRRLEDAQTSYQEIVGETRRNLAVDYLAHTSLSTGAIAEILGYSDTANFRQAFKRWTGGSPQEYRRMARSDGLADRVSKMQCAQCEEMASSRCARRNAVTPNDDEPRLSSTC